MPAFYLNFSSPGKFWLSATYLVIMSAKVERKRGLPSLAERDCNRTIIEYATQNQIAELRRIEISNAAKILY